MLLAVVHVIMEFDNKGDMRRSLKCCDFKTSNHPSKMGKYETNTLHIFKKTRTTVFQNLLLFKIYT